MLTRGAAWGQHSAGHAVCIGSPASALMCMAAARAAAGAGATVRDTISAGGWVCRSTLSKAKHALEKMQEYRLSKGLPDRPPVPSKPRTKSKTKTKKS
jgi:hypothetical protein